MMERPKLITDEHLEYLDELRDSGDTNMYGAAPYVEEAFNITRADAYKILKYWIKTFADRHAAQPG